MVVSHSTAKRYALALFDLAVEEKIEQTIRDNFIEFIETVENNDTLYHALHAPIVAEASQNKLIDFVTKKSEWHRHFKSFLYLLCRKRRLSLVTSIHENFVNLLKCYRGEITARLVSATKLTQENKKTIKKNISRHFSAQTVTLEEEVDADLLGGFVIDVQSLRVDASLRGELRRMEDHLRAVNLGKGN